MGDSFPNKRRNTADTNERPSRSFLEAARLADDNLKTSGAVNCGFEEDGKGGTQTWKRNTVIPVSLVDFKTLSGSLPSLVRPKLSPRAWSDEKSTKGSQSNGSSLRLPKIQRASSLKNVKVKEQLTIEKGSL